MWCFPAAPLNSYSNSASLISIVADFVKRSLSLESSWRARSCTSRKLFPRNLPSFSKAVRIPQSSRTAQGFPVEHEFVTAKANLAAFQLCQVESSRPVKVENIFGRRHLVRVASNPVHDVVPAAHPTVLPVVGP